VLGVVGGGTEESGIIGVAADDSVEGHHVGGSDRRGDRSEVGMGEGHSVRVAQPCRLGHRDGEVGLGRVNLGGASKPVCEEDVVNGTDPAADVEEGRVGWERARLDRS
jgi:hypothetical protein